jgi:hypothetical protein
MLQLFSRGIQETVETPTSDQMLTDNDEPRLNRRRFKLLTRYRYDI